MRAAVPGILLALVSVFPPGLGAVTDSLRTATVIADARRERPAPSDSASFAELRSAPDLAAAVRRFCGVQVKDYGGVGGLKTVNVRSLGSEHTGVFVDGIQVDQAQNMQVDLGKFDLESFSSLALYGGRNSGLLQSAKEYGAASALHLRSAAPVFSPGQRLRLSTRLRTGAFGTVAPTVALESRAGRRVCLRAQAGMLTAHGRYPFRMERQRLLDDGSWAGYDTSMVRRNGDIRVFRADLSLYGSLRDSNGSWMLRGWYYDSERGLPGPVVRRASAVPDSRDRQADRNGFVQGRWQRVHRLFGLPQTTRVQAKYAADWLLYADFPEHLPEGEPALFRYLSHTAYASFADGVTLPRGWALSLAADGQYQHLDASAETMSSRPFRWSAYAVVAPSWTRPHFSLSGSLLYTAVRGRSEGRRERRHVLSPSLSVNWQPAGGPVSLESYVRRAFRMPSFNDLYYTSSGVSLQPEDALQGAFAAGWTRRLGPQARLQARLETSRILLRNKIVAVPTMHPLRWSMCNIGRVHSFETSARLRLLLGDEADRKGVSGAVTGRYTFQRARDMSDRGLPSWRGQIPYIPLHSGSLSGWLCWRRLRADADVTAVGERFSSAANRPEYRLNSYLTADLSLSGSFPMPARGRAGEGGEITLRLQLNNLTDTQYAVVPGYPMPGFHALLSAGIRF